MTMHLTENEKEVLRAGGIEGDYEYGFSYEVCVWNYMHISDKVARGALSSLVKKGILTHRRVREDGMLWNIYSVNDEYLDEVKSMFN